MLSVGSDLDRSHIALRYNSDVSAPSLKSVYCRAYNICLPSLTKRPCTASLRNSAADCLAPCMHRYRLHIVGETVEDIKHCLLALPGTRQSDLRRMISDAAALSDCDAFVRSLPGVVRQAVDDSAGAAKMVAENGWR